MCISLWLDEQLLLNKYYQNNRTWVSSKNSFQAVYGSSLWWKSSIVAELWLGNKFSIVGDYQNNTNVNRINSDSIPVLSAYCYWHTCILPAHMDHQTLYPSRQQRGGHSIYQPAAAQQVYKYSFIQESYRSAADGRLQSQTVRLLRSSSLLSKPLMQLSSLLHKQPFFLFKLYMEDCI